MKFAPQYFNLAMLDPAAKYAFIKYMDMYEEDIFDKYSRNRFEESQFERSVMKDFIQYSQAVSLNRLARYHP